MQSRTSLPCLLVLASTYPRWSGDSEPGFVHELARRMVGRFRVLVLCPHAPGASTHEFLDGVEVIRYRYAPERLETLVNSGGIVANLKQHRLKYLLVPTFALAQVWHAWRICRREQVEVIHAHWIVPQGLSAALLAFLPGGKAPFLVTTHGADLFALRARPLQAIKRFVLRHAARVTAVSHAMLAPLAALGATGGRVQVQSMGVAMTNHFVPDERALRSTSELLFVGRLVEKKGLRYLLEALPAVVRQCPEITLTIAGFGPEEPFLRARVKQLRLDAVVNFLGAVPQSALPELYRRAALFVAPFVQASSGDQEGLGLVMVEAIGCGCPVLAGNVPAVNELLGPEWQVDARNTEQLAARIIELLGSSAELTVRLASLRADLVARFDWAHVAAHYADQLDALR